MKLFKILLAGAVGTLYMTAFSYIVAAKRKKQFEEPIILNRLLRRGAPLNIGKSNVAGWLLHYVTGVGFVMAFQQVWRKTKLEPHLISGLGLGAGAGLVGIGIWESTFRLHPNPPLIDRKEYYTQLLIAHLIFGATASLIYKRTEEVAEEIGEEKQQASSMDKISVDD